jgi:hypothetical protein
VEIERRKTMPNSKTFLIFAIVVVVAFGIGYGWGYLKLQNAEKEWTSAKEEMQAKISTLEKDLALTKARVSLWEMPLRLSQVSVHLSEKNFGLATQSLDQIKEIFSKAKATLEGELKGKLDFFLLALEEIRNEAQNMNPNTKKKIEELQNRFEQALRSGKTD